MMLIISSRYCIVAWVVAQVVSVCNHDMNSTGSEIESRTDLFSVGYIGFFFFLFVCFNTCYITLSLLIYHGLRLDISIIMHIVVVNIIKCLVLYCFSWLPWH